MHLANTVSMKLAKYRNETRNESSEIRYEGVGRIWFQDSRIPPAGHATLIVLKNSLLSGEQKTTRKRGQLSNDQITARERGGHIDFSGKSIPFRRTCRSHFNIPTPLGQGWAAR